MLVLDIIKRKQIEDVIGIKTDLFYLQPIGFFDMIDFVYLVATYIVSWTRLEKPKRRTFKDERLQIIRGSIDSIAFPSNKNIFYEEKVSKA